MTPRDALEQAWSALAGHPLRAILSSIGIVFGIATVIAAFAIGDGARREAFDEIGALGIDNVFVRAIQPAPPPSGRQRAPAPALTTADARALAAIPDVAVTSAVRSTRIPVRADGPPVDLSFVGVTAGWIRVAAPTLRAGRWFADQDVRARTRVAVIGADVARRLFAAREPLGHRVLAAGAWFDVIGVLDDRSRAAAGRAPVQRVDLNTAVLVPLAAMDVSLGEGDAGERINEIAIRVAGDVERTAAAVSAMLVRRIGAPSTYELVIPRELLQTRLRAQRTFDGVLIAIGGLALVISGIGIMNIMLATVAERAQEIGVRRAFGATRRAVLMQFALEAGVLCVAGGLVGVPAGAILSGLVAWLAGWPVAISPFAIALALTLSSSVGLVAGVYPARLAASIDPASALRAP